MDFFKKYGLNIKKHLETQSVFLLGWEKLYCNSTLAPASSNFFLISSASFLATFSFTMPFSSATFLASPSPRLVTSLITLIT